MAAAGAQAVGPRDSARRRKHAQDKAFEPGVEAAKRVSAAV